MCRGIFHSGPQCQLFIQAVVGIGSPAPQNARTIRFLLDTGATNTMISAADAVRLGLSYDSRGNPIYDGSHLVSNGSALGVGGAVRIFRLDKVFFTIVSYGDALNERHTEYFRNVEVAGVEYQDESLIGMDLLQRFRLLVDSENNIVNLTRRPVKGTGYLVEHA